VPIKVPGKCPGAVYETELAVPESPRALRVAHDKVLAYTTQAEMIGWSGAPA
jgi:hypothetical protein